jgi:hypothetical protein
VLVPKHKNYLSYVSAPAWAMGPARCASSGCSHCRTFENRQAGHRRPCALVKVTDLLREGKFPEVRIIGVAETYRSFVPSL